MCSPIDLIPPQCDALIEKSIITRYTKTYKSIDRKRLRSGGKFNSQVIVIILVLGTGAGARAPASSQSAGVV